MRSGWCLGEEEFRKELLAQVSEEEKAKRLVKEELVRRKWVAKDLAGKPKTDSHKTCIALRLRRETTKLNRQDFLQHAVTWVCVVCL